MLDCIGSYWMTAQYEMAPHLITLVSSLKTARREMLSNCPVYQPQHPGRDVDGHLDATASELTIALAGGQGSRLRC